RLDHQRPLAQRSEAQMRSPARVWSRSSLSCGERAQVAPGSHGHANRDETRLLATPANPHHYAQSRMNPPPPHVHGKEGVDGSSPSEGFAETPANQPFDLSGL